MKIHELKGKRILLAGYGVEGKATEEYLRSIYPEASITVADKSQGDSYLDRQEDFDIAIKSPGIHKSL
jgi:UDP-N-acetylmuramoyl-L-alanine---L-glutamate ligase